MNVDDIHKCIQCFLKNTLSRLEVAVDDIIGKVNIDLRTYFN